LVGPAIGIGPHIHEHLAAAPEHDTHIRARPANRCIENVRAQAAHVLLHEKIMPGSRARA
jgi:hypothetical protein